MGEVRKGNSQEREICPPFYKNCSIIKRSFIVVETNEWAPYNKRLSIKNYFERCNTYFIN
jgi:hypothetical protein